MRTQELHPKLGKPLPTRIATAVLCALLGLIAVPLAWAQAGSATIQEEESVEGDRLFEAAITAYEQGQMFQAARLWEKALTIYTRELGAEHPDTLASMNNLATSYSDLGQHDKALELEEQTLRLSRARLGDDHPDTLASMNNLAITYSDLGQHDKALALIPVIVAGAEKLRTQPGLSTEQQQSIFAKYSDDYQTYAGWYAIAKRQGEGFRLGDLSKARTLTDSIKAQAAMRSLPTDEQGQLQASQGKAQALQTQLKKTSSASRNTGAILSLQKEIDSHNTAHARLLADLQARYPKYAQLTAIQPVAAADGQRLLGSHEAFVSYLVRTNGQAQAFVLDQSGEVQWINLGQINNQAKTVAAYRELLSPSTEQSPQGRLVALKDGGYEWLLPGQAAPKDASPAADKVTDAVTLLNRYWHNKLIKPVLPLAGKHKRWIISPDKDLALLPFDTLPETPGVNGESSKTLGQTHNLTLVQSFSVYALLKQREAEYAQLPRTKELFAMGNAVYGEGWADNRGMQRASGARGFESKNRNASAFELSPDTASPGAQVLKPAAEQYAISQLDWKNLPGTAHELKTVSAVFASTAKGSTGGTSAVDSYTGLEASEDKMQKLNVAGKLKDYRYLLFSAHGYLAQNPALSALVLSQRGNPEGIDGYVTAGEWPLYDLKSDLTVLSACDTGVGKTQAGESVMGLPYALFVAGNKSTILTLWPVDDNATAEFMRSFFTKLKAGVQQSDALSQTKQELMQHPQWSHPRFWAAFVLYGV